jgi:muconate cycloisomerase
MKIARIDVYPLRLPMREAFHIARGSVGDPESGAPHVYVQVTADDGRIGWGEARPSHRWSYETEESVVAALERYLAPVLIGRPAWDLHAIHREMDRQLAPGISTGNPIARSALDMALHDLLARAAGVPLAAFLGGRDDPSVSLCRIIAVPDPAEAERRAAAAWTDGYRGLKVKIGHGAALDLDLLRAVRAGAPDAYLWADANQAYDLSAAIALARRLAEVDVDCLEQPLPAHDWTGLRRLRAAAPVPIAADESVFAPADLIQLVRLEALDLLVMKVAKMGGISRALLAGRIAREAGIGLLGSGLTESGVGFAASVHLYGAFDDVRFADLNGPQFLADDPTTNQGPIGRGRASAPPGPGIGVAIDPEKLERFRSVG